MAKVTVPTKRLDKSPSEECAVWIGTRDSRRFVIRRFKEKFGVWPEKAYFVTRRTGGQEWWLPLPNGEEVV